MSWICLSFLQSQCTPAPGSTWSFIEHTCTSFRPYHHPYLNSHLTARQCTISFVCKSLYVCGLSLLMSLLPSEESPTSCVLICVRSSIHCLLQRSPVSPPASRSSKCKVSHLYSTSSCNEKISPLTPILHIDLSSGHITNLLLSIYCIPVNKLIVLFLDALCESASITVCVHFSLDNYAAVLSNRPTHLSYCSLNYNIGLNTHNINTNIEKF